MMNTTTFPDLVDEVPAYAALQRHMHDALRAEHPEWVAPNGDSPMCDFYESRFAQLLNFSLATECAHARPQVRL